ncbi:MAG: Na/Pi cotransporter family protein [bacterium]
MNDGITTLVAGLGGLGVFLLGMIVMTQGLRELAGDQIRHALMRFTATPVSGALTGAVSTAVLQSSSATTVAAVGFVGAGLMTFSASLGVIFGANIGTTITGWLVALLGFKLKLALFLLPLILVGAILRMFARGRLRAWGFALAGFGLIFAGILSMQEGMAGLQGFVTPETLPADSFAGRFLIVLIGMLITIITQSSSAGVAATLAALYADVISFEQGLALVIGMDIGTTVTAVMATIGGTTAARRTGLSHLIYNLFTGMGAILLITPYLWVVQRWIPEFLSANPELTLVAFHTLFNTLGVLLVLPFTRHFARMIKRIIPDSPSSITAPLDESLLTSPIDALNAVQQAQVTAFNALLNHLRAILTNNGHGRREDLLVLQQSLDELERYLDQIRMTTESGSDYDRLVESVQSLDHLQRLHERCEEDEDRAIIARQAPDLRAVHQKLVDVAGVIQEAVASADWHRAENSARSTEQNLVGQVEPLRDMLAANRAMGKFNTVQMTGGLEALRWVSRVAHHLACISEHMQQSLVASGR